MARESRAKRARTAANGGEGDAVSGGTSGQGGTHHASASSNTAAASLRGGGAAPAGAASGSCSNGAASSTVAAAMAGGGSPLDALPDELLGRVLLLAARRGWIVPTICGGTFLLDPKEDEPDVQPKQLVQLKAVCRRFRRIVDDGGLWGRVALRQPNDAAVEALTTLPEQSRKAVRRIVIQGGSTDISVLGLCKLAAAFRDQLDELSIIFGGADAAQLPFAGLASIQHMQRLRSLNVRVPPSAYASASAFAAPAVLQSLSVLSLLPNLQMLDLSIPLPLSVLEALARPPLVSSLRALLFRAAISGDERPAAVFAAAAKFTSLEKLKLISQRLSGNEPSIIMHMADDLQSLCALTQMQELIIGNTLGWIGFISHMPQLQSLRAGIIISGSSGIDMAPLFAAPALKATLLGFFLQSPEHAATAASALASCRSLEDASFVLPLVVYEALAGSSLRSWAQMQRLSIELYGDGSTIPGSFLKRLASDVPSLRRLEVNSALPVTTDLVSISSLNYLAQLQVSNKVAVKMSKVERQLLTSSLLDVRVVFTGINHPSQTR
eukprot:tig00000219_g19464.t1